MAREHVTSTIPINDGMSVLWARDPRCVWDGLLGLLEGGGVPAVEPLVEGDKEEEQRKRAPMASEAGPL